MEDLRPDLHRRLDGLGASIRELMRLGGMPGLSLSVATEGQPVYHASYGVRDLEASLPVTEDTVFPVCSLAKGVSAAAMGILVDRGATSWETLAADAVPSFQPRDARLRDKTTLADLYSHRSGMSSCGQLVNGCEGNVLIGRDDCMRVVNQQTLVPDLRGVFAYNSTAYDLCDEALSTLGGSTVEDFVQNHVFEPLGMHRTSMMPMPAGTDDVTKSYNALDDATPWCVPSPRIGEHGISCGSGGLRSCATDLVKLYSAFVRSFNHERRTGQTSTPGSPLKQITRLMSPHVPMGKSRDEDSPWYGLGWARARLPCSLGHIGLNGRLMPDAMPVVGKGASGGRGPLVLYHQGTLPGALAVVILLPDTDSVVLVMGNCLSLTDVPDWVSQMVLEELLDVPAPERIDFAAHAQRTIDINLAWQGWITDSLARGRPPVVASHRPLASYLGSYVDGSNVFRVDVTLAEEDEDGKPETLCWAFQGLASERYPLTHYSGDTFTWLQPRNDLSRRGRCVLGCDRDSSFWKVEFGAGEGGDIQRVIWRHDPGLDPIVYTRRDRID